jgi:hypothetical protein
MKRLLVSFFGRVVLLSKEDKHRFVDVKGKSWRTGNAAGGFARVTAACVTLLVVLSLGTAIAPRAQAAANANNFDAGYIISDSRFYDSNAMTASQIQTFLNQQVPTCHPEWDSSPSSVVCLKDYKTTTTSKANDSYCAGYTGGQNQSAAQVIDGVARSCGVSQQILLVLLQKENGLVTHSWPSPWRYKTAMGYGCPDTAACDSQYYGFFNQVYNAARQYKLYQAKPTSYQYRIGSNNIYWNPNSACGYSTVTIRNQATAGLYNYTPYRPNQAALNAGYGSGDGCSSYGNRNFYLYYSDWFGDPVEPPIQLVWFLREEDIAVGAAASYPSRQLQYRWQSYNLATSKWRTIADWNSANWAGWADNVGDYWLHLEVRDANTQEVLGSKTISFRYQPGTTQSTGTYSGWSGNQVLLGQASNNPRARFVTKIYNVGTGQWVQQFNSAWAYWNPSPGTYWTHYEVYTSDGRLADVKTYAFGVS